MNRLVASLPTLIAALAIINPASPADEPARLTIDARSPGAVISPLLFGHNLEITRRGAWTGLDAELVANRKFAGDAKDDGLPRRWYAITAGGRVMTEVDGSLAFAGRQCARIDVTPGGRGAGIGQYGESISLRKGTSYAWRAWIRSETPRKVSIRVTDGPGGRVHLEAEEAVEPGDWRCLSASFLASTDEANARFEITSRDEGTYRIGAVSIQPADHFRGMRRDVVDLLKELHVGVLRWPGGCFAEYYPWKDGLLPVDRRPPIGKAQWDMLLPNTDGYDTHEIGIDDYVALCREIGAEPAITVRLGYGSPGEMAAWVQYCNGGPDTPWGKIRAGRGHAEPYRVKYWFVGNEIYWSGLNGSTDPATFVRLSKAFAAAMKGADPSIRLIGGTYFDPAHLDTWEKPLLEAAGPYLDLASYHQYQDMKDDSDVPAKLRAATAVTRPSLRKVRDYLNAHPVCDRRLGITLDEWNINWGRTPGDVPGGVFAANMLNMLGRDASALGVDLACYFMPVNEGCIAVEPSQAYLCGDGRVFALYRVHQGNRVVPITPPQPDDADVDAMASLSPDDSRIWATLVNRSASRPAPVRLLIRGGAGFHEGAVYSMVPRALRQGASFAESESSFAGADDGLSLTLAPGSVTRVRFGPASPSGAMPAISKAEARLIAHLAFDETPSAPARLVGGARLVAGGHRGGGLELNGRDGWFDAGSRLIDTSQSFSATAWVKLGPGYESTFRTVVSQDDDAVSGFYLQTLPLAGAGPRNEGFRLTRWKTATGGDLRPAAASGRPEPGRWYHLAGVQDIECRVFRLFVDGRLAAEAPLDGLRDSFRWPSRGHTLIGRGLYNGGPVDPFLGVIDEVSLYDGAIGEARVRTDMEEGLGRPSGR